LGVGGCEVRQLAAKRGHHHKDASLVGVHELDQRIDGLASKMHTMQPVSLFDYEHAVEGPIADLERLRTALADIGGHETRRNRAHHMPVAKQTEAAKQLAERASHMALADAWRSHEQHMQLLRRSDTLMVALGSPMGGEEFSDLPLDRVRAYDAVEADQRIVQMIVVRHVRRSPPSRGT